MHDLKLSIYRSLYLCLITIFCAGCSTTSDYQFPLQNSSEFSNSGTNALPDKWWHSLNDRDLNAHIEYALQKNFSLAAAWERLNAANAIARRKSADLYPDLDIGAAVNREINSGNNDDRFTFGPTASYEVDLWGRIRSQAAAEELRAEAAEEAYHTAALTLSANIAITWVRLIEAYNQIDLLNSQIATNKKALDVLEARFGIGQIRSEDILRQQLLIESVKEEKIVVESQIQTLEHQLAVLRGEAPQGKKYQADKLLPTLPPLPATGLPADLIKKRPDIRQAYLEVLAADKDLAAAIRDRYPSLTLSASYISEAASAGNLFSDWVTSLAAGLVGPVIDGGQRRAEVSRSEAVRNELLSLYGQNVLEAFEEVENALIQEEKQREQIDNLQKRLNLARETYDQIQLGYFNGANEFLSLLNAQDELQETERNMIRSRRNLVEIRIALYRALAGSFTTARE